MDTRYHDVSAFALAGTQIALAAVFDQSLLVFSGLGSLSGLLLSPDLDWRGELVYDGFDVTRIATSINPKREWEYRRKRIYSKVARRWPVPLRQWWFLFALTLSHRGLSHEPVLGTLLRLVWIAPLVALAAWFFPIQTGLWACGLLAIDLAHWLLDGRP